MEIPKKKAYGMLVNRTLSNGGLDTKEVGGVVYSSDGTRLGRMTSSNEDFLKEDLKRLFDNEVYDYEYVPNLPEEVTFLLDAANNKKGY